MARGVALVALMRATRGMDQLRWIALALEVPLEEVIVDSPIDEAGDIWLDDPAICAIHDQVRRIGELDPTNAIAACQPIGNGYP